MVIGFLLWSTLSNAQLLPDPLRASAAEDPPKAWLGVLLETEQPPPTGASVRAVVPDSPADRAGLQPGDHIVAVDAHVIENASALPQVIQRYAPGTQVTLQLVDPARSVTMVLTVGPQDWGEVASGWIGKPLPPLEITATDSGTTTTLQWDPERWTIFFFWASWCRPCHEALPYLEQWAKDYPTVRWMALSDEPLADVRQHLQQYPLPIASWVTTQHAAQERWWITALPAWLVVNEQGEALAYFRSVGGIEAFATWLTEHLPAAP